MPVDSDRGAIEQSGLSLEEMRDILVDVAGIDSLEIDLRTDGSPRLRIRLDGSLSAADVGHEIRRRVAEKSSEPAVPRRRSGLGRGLIDLLAEDADVEPPSHLHAAVAGVSAPTSLSLVAIEETAGGISVRASDSSGAVAFSPVEDPRSLNQAIVSAIGRLRQEKPLPRLTGVEIRDVDGSPVLTVVLGLADGSRVVGSALVEGGMPFTMGRAVWEALCQSTNGSGGKHRRP